jgi:hypothetical protein
VSEQQQSTESVGTANRFSPSPLETAVHSASAELLTAAAADPSLTEDLALALVKRSDLPAEALVGLSKNPGVSKQRKVRVGIVQHPKTPRHISVPMLRVLYTFDLMNTALAAVVPADVKRGAENVLFTRLESISSGEKLALARRASGRIAAELLLDKESRVMRAALENARLTEAAVIKALGRRDASGELVNAVCHHAKWSRPRDVRIALLRNEKTPLARALEFARSVPPSMFHEILRNSHLPAGTKAYLLKDFEQRTGRSRHTPQSEL